MKTKKKFFIFFSECSVDEGKKWKEWANGELFSAAAFAGDDDGPGAACQEQNVLQQPEPDSAMAMLGDDGYPRTEQVNLKKILLFFSV